MSPGEKKVRAQASVLRRACRPLLPVRLFFRKEIVDDDGTVCRGLCRVQSRRGKCVGFSIFIRRASFSEMSDILVHEWAHALTWNEGDMFDCIDDHDAAFGIAQARCYRALEDF